MSSTTLSVDPAALSELASRLRCVQTRIEGMRADQPTSQAFGPSCLVHAFDRLAGNWSRDQEDLMKTMGSVVDGLVRARDGYSETDRELAHGMAGG
jgi:hypothetical protein